MGCAEEVASVHVEGWNLSCRAYTLNITDQSQKHTHKRPPQICNNKTSCEARYQICEKRDFQLIIISIQVTRGISVYIRTQVFPSPAADWETYTCGVCCCWGRRGGTQPS